MTRVLRALVGLVMVATISGGCSSAPARTSNGNNSTHQGQAIKFAECMRVNGIKEFPDPNASGDFTIDAVANNSSLDTESPAFTQALNECQDLQPAGFTGEKRTPNEQKAGLAFAQCIRDNGVPDFPDPTPDSPLVDTNRIPSAASGDEQAMAALNAAMKTCGHLVSDQVAGK